VVAVVGNVHIPIRRKLNAGWSIKLIRSTARYVIASYHRPGRRTRIPPHNPVVTVIHYKNLSLSVYPHTMRCVQLTQSTSLAIATCYYLSLMRTRHPTQDAVIAPIANKHDPLGIHKYMGGEIQL
jgi:hypothetical protein